MSIKEFGRKPYVMVADLHQTDTGQRHTEIH